LEYNDFKALENLIMVDLKAKVVLSKKGDEAYIPVKRLLVTLKWTAKVDLDLMAFYRTKDGREGGVFSDRYPGGNLGNLKEFPYIKLSGDQGVGAKGGDNEEVLGVGKLDDLSELYICTLNYTDASRKKDSSFHDYDGGITILCDGSNTIAVPLDSTEKGQVALIAKIDNSNPISAKLINENKIMSLFEFVDSIPGAKLLIN
jgi:uncharacterized protein involved in tellurium resistance